MRTGVVGDADEDVGDQLLPLGLVMSLKVERALDTRIDFPQFHSCEIASQEFILGL